MKGLVTATNNAQTPLLRFVIDSKLCSKRLHNIFTCCGFLLGFFGQLVKLLLLTFDFFGIFVALLYVEQPGFAQADTPQKNLRFYWVNKFLKSTEIPPKQKRHKLIQFLLFLPLIMKVFIMVKF